MLLPDAEIAKKFREALNGEGIPTGLLYNGEPIYMLPQIFNKKTADGRKFPFDQFDEEIVYTKDMCPKAWDIMPRSATIYLSPVFTQQEVSDIVKAIRKVAKYLL